MEIALQLLDFRSGKSLVIDIADFLADLIIFPLQAFCLLRQENEYLSPVFVASVPIDQIRRLHTVEHIKAQMVFPWTVVIAEGAACLDLGSSKRPRIDGKPTPPGCIHDRNFVINFVSQAESPLFIHAARCTGLSA